MRKGPEATPQGLRKIRKRSALGALYFLQVNKVRYAGGQDLRGEGSGLWLGYHGYFPKIDDLVYPRFLGANIYFLRFFSRGADQQHPQVFSCQAARPSFRRNGMAIRAASESNHGRWNTAFTAKPARVARAR